MFLHVTAVRYLEGYKLAVTFDDDSVREIDLEPELHGEVFEPLRDLKLFRQVYLNPETGTVEWPNEADFAPEFLHATGRPTKQLA